MLNSRHLLLAVLLDLLVMLLVQKFQEYIAIPLLALVSTNIFTPASYCTGKSTRHALLLYNLNDGQKIGPDRKYNPATSRQPPQRLSLASEVMMLNGTVLLGSIPADFRTVLTTN